MFLKNKIFAHDSVFFFLLNLIIRSYHVKFENLVAILSNSHISHF